MHMLMDRFYRVQVDSALGQFGNQNSDQSKDRLGLDIQSQQACL